MKLSGMMARLDDRLNPITVRELRQAVQSKFVVAVLLLFLMLQLVIVGGYLTSVAAQGQVEALDSQGGRVIFGILQGVLLGTCMLFLPAHTGTRLAMEHSDVNVDLLFITTLRPRAIIWGKFLAALILALMIFSACAPFMTFTYLLRGIEVPAILAVLAIDLLVVAAAIQLAIFLAAAPANRVMRALLGLWGLIGLIYLFVGTMTVTLRIIEFGIGTSLDSWQFWTGVGAGGVTIVTAIGLLFSWSVALISPPSANRALPVRLWTLLLWLVTGVTFAAWSQAIDSTAPLGGWVGYMAGLAALMLMIAVNEREQWGPRLARTIPRRWWLRVPAFLFYSGAAGGVTFAVLLFVLTGLAAWWQVAHSFPFAEESLRIMLGLLAVTGLYAYCYALTALLFRRLGGKRVRPDHTWALMILCVAVGCTVPFLISFLLFFRDWNYDRHYPWLLANPFAAAVEVIRPSALSHARLFFGFVGCWTVAVTLLNLTWFLEQLRRFRPHAGSPSLAAGGNRSPALAPEAARSG